MSKSRQTSLQDFLGKKRKRDEPENENNIVSLPTGRNSDVDDEDDPLIEALDGEAIQQAEQVETQPYGEDDLDQTDTQAYGGDDQTDTQAYGEEVLEAEDDIDAGVPVDDEVDDEVAAVGTGKGRKRTKTHRSKFDPSWKNNRPWLIYTPQKGMECEWCQRHTTADQKNRNPAWTREPCVSFRLDAVKRHQKGVIHQQSMRQETEIAATIAKGGISTALKTPVTLNRKAIVAALRVMYWLVKNEIATTTKFEPLLNLVQSLGCDYVDRLTMRGIKVNYTSEQAKQEFVHLLAADLTARRLDEIRRSPCYGLLIDESTDISNTKQLIMYIRYLDSDAQAQTTFLTIVDINNGRAETIFNAIEAVLQEKRLPMDKLAGFGSDGASVMVGRENGVAAMLKREHEGLISVHCVAHRLALGVSQAAGEGTYVTKYKRTLDQLTSFFNKGSSRQASFREIQKLLGEPILKLVDAKDVRWLSHNAAVTAIRRTLPALITTMEREAAEKHDAVAIGLSRAIKSFNFVAATCMLSDILPKMSALSKHFQRMDIDFTVVGDHVFSAKSWLLWTAKGGEGHHMRTMQEYMATLPGVEEYSQEKFDRFVTGINDPFVDRLVINLEDRFDDASILQSFREFIPNTIDVDEPLEDGPDSNLQKLSNHFDLPLADLTQEWEHMRMIAHVEHRRLGLREFLQKVVTAYGEVTPLLARMAARSLIVPVSTADCERGFSAMNRLRTKARNNLSKMLEPSMWIVVEGPPYDMATEDYFDRVATSWAGRARRRLTI